LSLKTKTKTMSDSDPADRIRQQMRIIRREMGADVKDIVLSAQQLSDWRYYVRKYPWLCVGAAFGLGLFLAPNRRKAASIEKLAAHMQNARLAGFSATGAPSQGLVQKALAMAGPFVARSALSFIASRFGERPRSGGEEEHDQPFEPMGKPR
jgi:hypothetical protein